MSKFIDFAKDANEDIFNLKDLFLVVSFFVVGTFILTIALVSAHGPEARAKAYVHDMLMDQRKVDAYRAKVLAEEQFTKITSNPEQD